MELVVYMNLYCRKARNLIPKFVRTQGGSILIFLQILTVNDHLFYFLSTNFNYGARRVPYAPVPLCATRPGKLDSIEQSGYLRCIFKLNRAKGRFKTIVRAINMVELKQTA